MEVRAWPGHGRAAVATSRHAAGTAVLRERPFLVWTGHMDSPASFAACLRAFAALTPDERQAAADHFAAPKEGTVVAREVQRAAETLAPNGAAHGISASMATTLLGLASINNHAYGRDQAALFWTGAMVSHACDPNVRYSSADGALTYTAIRDIEPGELITYCYLPLDWLLRPTRDRARRLLIEYDFVCDCPRCTGPDWARGFPCTACAGPAAPAAALSRIGHTFPTETAYLRALGSAPRELLAHADLDGPAAWQCTRCSSTEPPAAARLAREGYWRSRWNVLDGPLDAGAPPATEPRGPTPLDGGDFRAELERVQTDLGRIHHLTAVWHRLLAETLMIFTPALAWAEAGRVAAFCQDVLQSPYLVHALRGPYLIRLADAAHSAAPGLPPNTPAIADVGPTWLHWAAYLGPRERGTVQTLVQRLAAAAGCAQCGKHPSPQTCSRCHAVAYCSRECQKAHWKAHKAHCLPAATTATTTSGAAALAAAASS